MIPDVTVHRNIFGDFRDVTRRFTKRCNGHVRCFVCGSGRLTGVSTFTSSGNVRTVVVGARTFGTSLGRSGGGRNHTNSSTTHVVFSHHSRFNSQGPVSVLTGAGPVLVVSRPRDILKASGDGTAQGNVGLFGPLFALLCDTARHRVFGRMCHLSTVSTCGGGLIGGVRMHDIRRINSATAGDCICLSRVIVDGNGPRTQLNFSIGATGNAHRAVHLINRKFSLGRRDNNLRRCTGGFGIRYVSKLAGAIRFLGKLALRPNRIINDIGRSVLHHRRVHRAVGARLRHRHRLFTHNVGILSLFFVSRISDCHVCNGSATRGKGFTQVFRRRCRHTLRRLVSAFGSATCAHFLSGPGGTPRGVRSNCFSVSGGKGGIRSGGGRNRGRRHNFSLVVGSGRHLLDRDYPVHFVFSRSTLGRN